MAYSREREPIYIEVEPGLVVDQDGEIIEGPAGKEGDLLRVIASRVIDWQDQNKVYEQAIAGGKSAIMRLQSDKRALYGNVVANKIASEVDNLDLQSFRLDVIDMELQRTEMLSLILAATGFDKDLVSVPELVALLAEHTRKVPRASYVKLTRAMEPPPKVTRGAA